MPWKIEVTEIFEKQFEKEIPDNLKKDLKKQINKLADDPYNSKPLGYKFFREKKIRKWRIYFLIYDEVLVIYFVDISNKKTQQTKIDKIKSLIAKYREIILKK